MTNTSSQKYLFKYATFFAIFSNILWGSAFPTLKIVYAEMAIARSDFASIISFIGLRFLLAGLFVLAFARYRKQAIFSLTKKQWAFVVLLGLTNTTIQYFFFNIGINNTPGIKASILGQIGIFFSVILAHFIGTDDKLNLRKILGLSLGFAGLIVVNFNAANNSLSGFKLVGEGFMMLSGLVSALSMFIAKRIGKEVSPLLYTGWQMVIGSMLLLLLGSYSGANPLTLQFTPLSTVLMVYLAIVSSVAFVLWYSILQYRKIGEISLYKFVVPLSGSLLTALFIPSETLLPVHVIGLGLVSVGIVIVNRRK